MNDLDYRLLFSHSPVPIAIICTQGNFMKANARWSEFIGYSNSELENSFHFNEITHPSDIAGGVAVMKMFRDNDKMTNYNWIKRYITKNGKVVWHHIYIRAVRDSQNKILYYITTLIPLPNGEQFKIIKSEDKVIIRPNVDMLHFVKSNWKWFISAFVATGFFIWKIVSVMTLVLDKLDIPW